MLAFTLDAGDERTGDAATAEERDAGAVGVRGVAVYLA